MEYKFIIDKITINRKVLIGHLDFSGNRPYNSLKFSENTFNKKHILSDNLIPALFSSKDKYCKWIKNTKDMHVDKRESNQRYTFEDLENDKELFEIILEKLKKFLMIWMIT